MSVYVGPLFDASMFPSCPPSLKGRRVCHLCCDPGNLEELHTLAKKLKLKPEWFQDKRVPHYDITDTLREKAVALGAVELTFAQEAELHNKYPVMKK